MPRIHSCPKDKGTSTDKLLYYLLSIAREKGHYRLAGVMLAWSLVHGGPGGNFLSTSLFNAIAQGSNEPVSIDSKDIPDQEILEAVAKVTCTTSLIPKVF